MLIRLSKMLATLMVLSLLLMACGGAEDTASEADADTEQEQPEATEEGEATVAPEPTAATEGQDAAAADGPMEPLDDGFPERPITLWSAFEPGHTDDQFNQAFADAARAHSPVPVTVQVSPQGPPIAWNLLREFESLPGGTEGYHMAAGAWGGNTLRLFTLEALQGRSLEEQNPVCVAQVAPYPFLVRQDSEFATLDDVLAFIQENPGELPVVGGATGGLLHSVILLWLDRNGLGPDDINFIPTDGSGETVQTLLGGGAEFAVTTYTPDLDEQFNILAVTGDQRFGGLPDVPTTGERGVDIPIASERGFMTHQDVPEEHVAWLSELCQRVSADPTFQDRLEGSDFVYKGPEEIRQFQQDVESDVIPLLRELGLTIDS